MKEKYIFIIVYVVLFIILAISLCYIFIPNKTPFGTMFKVYYDSLESSINEIEINMNEITINNETAKWYKLKEINTNDKNLVNTYNSLVSDIKACYMAFIDLDNKANILSYKNKERITRKEIYKIDNNEKCLKSFDKYDSMSLSDNIDLSVRMKNQIKIITSYEESGKIDKGLSNQEAFITLISEEVTNISKIASLSRWLRVEYNTYK